MNWYLIRSGAYMLWYDDCSLVKYALNKIKEDKNLELVYTHHGEDLSKEQRETIEKAVSKD